MDADFTVELGRDDPALDFPWTDPAGRLAYFDLKRQPELIAQIEEASTFPELGEFLRTVNSARSSLESAKCDAWMTTELSAEEDIYGASHKFASYVDLVFSDVDRRRSFPLHENFARRLAELLRRAPDILSSVEVCVRRCFFGDAGEGFYFTVYTSGYGNDEAGARRNWGVALKLAGSVMGQWSSSGGC
ncbi:MAG: hypothetical protein WA172_05075 [Terriglobales bacterium]